MFKPLLKTSLWLLWIVTFVMLLFLRGYLLTKIEIEKISTCADYQLGGPDASCWSKPRYKRAVLVLVDALRHDFTLYNSSLKPEDTKPWQNKMPIFSQLEKEQPKRTKHVEFIADPPSATFLRLKGLTTGGLPTFVDLGSNFGASEIAEDSWVQQLFLNNKNLVFMGDDTWMGIYNKYFYRSFPYPSFDVWDLHSVDNGVWKHLLPEMEKKDWDVIVAHFLGVDHAGHRYHVNHPELSHKLVQINNWVSEIVKHIDNDTILFIFGDHGMTTTGDHGGETHDEVTSTLFIYSGSEFRDLDHESLRPNRVFQTDIVPTLAMLLGVPIPYSSIGNIIPFLFLDRDDNNGGNDLLHVMKTNMNQVFRYIEAYSMISPEFSATDISSITQEVNQLNAEYDQSKGKFSLSLLSKMKGLISKIRKLCLESWAQFNLPVMMLAIILILFLSISLFISSNLALQVGWYSALPLGIVCVIGYDSLSLWSGVTHPFTVIVTIVTILLNLNSSKFYQCFSCSLAIQDLKNYQFPDLVSLLTISVVSIGFTTNSYILVEDYVTIFFFGTLCLSIFIQQFVRLGFKMNQSLKKDAIIILITMTMSRLSSIFYGCREEQFWCTKTWWFSDNLDDSYKNTTFIGCVAALLSTHFILYYYQKQGGNLAGPMNCIKFIHFTIQPIQCVLIAAYWALSASNTKVLTDNEMCWIPRVVYMLTFISLIMVLLKPSTIYIYHNLKEGTGRPMVYGLLTCYTAPSITIYSTLIPTFSLLLGMKMSPTLLLLTVQLLGLSQILRSCSLLTRVTLVHLVMLQYFYGTGHQAAVQQFDWNAAFVGFTSHSNNIVPATMIIMRTLMSIILTIIFAPLIVLNTDNTPTKTAKVVDIDGSSDQQVGQLKYFINKNLLSQKIEDFICKTTALNMFKCLWACVACYVHRRHLMIWSVFTPRVVLEMCFIVCSSGFSVLFVSILWRTNSQLSKTLDKLKIYKGF